MTSVSSSILVGGDWVLKVLGCMFFRLALNKLKTREEQRSSTVATDELKERIYIVYSYLMMNTVIGEVVRPSMYKICFVAMYT